MKITQQNETYRGFLTCRLLDGTCVATLYNANCCQSIRSLVREDINVIRFGFPNDWLINDFHNEKFIEWWTDLISTWFTKINYIGIGKCNDIFENKKFSVEEININNGYNEKFKFPFNRGDYIRNDKWHIFEIKPNLNLKNFAIFNYASFVLIRYIFCSYFQEVVKIYLHYISKAIDHRSGKYINNLDNFKLFQLAHYHNLKKNYQSYGDDEYSLGYSSIYGIMSYFKKCNDKTDDHFCYSLRSLEQVRSHLMLTPILNRAFSFDTTEISVRKLNKLLLSNKILDAYEIINK